MRCRSAAFRDSGKVPAAVACAGDSSAENAAAESIWRQVEAMPEFAAAARVLIYMSIPGEVPTREFIARWHGRKQFVLPRVCRESYLELHEYDPRWLVSGYRGIEEPSIDAPLVAPSDIDLALIPGVAFARGINSGSVASRDDFAHEVNSVASEDFDVISRGTAIAGNSGVWRLGRGGGFYDRLLPQLNCPTVGICFSYRLVDSLPLDPWDAPLTHLVTNI